MIEAALIAWLMVMFPKVWIGPAMAAIEKTIQALSRLEEWAERKMR